MSRHFGNVHLVRGYERPRDADGMDYGSCPDDSDLPAGASIITANGQVVVADGSGGAMLVPAVVASAPSSGKTFLLGVVAGWIFWKITR